MVKLDRFIAGRYKKTRKFSNVSSPNHYLTSPMLHTSAVTEGVATCSIKNQKSSKLWEVTGRKKNSMSKIQINDFRHFIPQRKSSYMWTPKLSLWKKTFGFRYKNRAREVSRKIADSPQPVREKLVSHFEFMAKYGPLPELNHLGSSLNFIVYHNIDVWAVILLVSLTLLALAFAISKTVVKFMLNFFSPTKSKVA